MAVGLQEQKQGAPGEQYFRESRAARAGAVCLSIWGSSSLSLEFQLLSSPFCPAPTLPCSLDWVSLSSLGFSRFPITVAPLLPPAPRRGSSRFLQGPAPGEGSVTQGKAAPLPLKPSWPLQALRGADSPQVRALQLLEQASYDLDKLAFLSSRGRWWLSSSWVASLGSSSSLLWHVSDGQRGPLPVISSSLVVETWLPHFLAV